MYYVALVHKEPDSAYGVSFPDFPGCVAAGQTFDKAVHDAVKALGLHVEGLREDGERVPAPRTPEEILAAEDAWWDTDGATLAAVPLIEDRVRKVRVNVTIPHDLLQAIDSLAEARGITRSAFLASASRREIDPDSETRTDRAAGR